MKLLYSEADGKIFYAVLDKDALTFEHSTNVPLATIEIDEIEANKALILKLIRGIRKTDEAGNPTPAYSVDHGTLRDSKGAIVTPSVDADAAALKVLSEKPSLTTEEKDQVLNLLLKKSATKIQAVETIDK